MNDYDPDALLQESLELINEIPIKIREKWEKKYLHNTTFRSLHNDYKLKKKIHTLREKTNQKTARVFKIIGWFLFLIFCLTFSLKNGRIAFNLIPVIAIFINLWVGAYIQRKQRSILLRTEAHMSKSRNKLINKIGQIKPYIPSVALHNISKNCLFDEKKMEFELRSASLAVMNARKELYMSAKQFAESERDEQIIALNSSPEEDELVERLLRVEYSRRQFQELQDINCKFGIVNLDNEDLFFKQNEEGLVLQT